MKPRVRRETEKEEKKWRKKRKEIRDGRRGIKKGKEKIGKWEMRGSGREARVKSEVNEKK